MTTYTHIFDPANSSPSLKRLGYHRLSLRDRWEMTSVAYRRIRPIRRRHHFSMNLMLV